jgi:serine/threonine-protein kinase
VRGARIVAVLTLVMRMVSWTVGSHHAGSIDVFWARFIVALSDALYFSVIFWLVYLAVEPYVRRRWPESLISWTRLLAGRITDPLVGRHILVGSVAGTIIVLIDAVSRNIPEWWGLAPISPLSGGNALPYLAGVGSFVGGLLMRFNRVLSESLAVMFLLLVAHATLRNRWLANIAIAAVFTMIAVNREAIVLTAISAIALVAIVLIVASRFGLLAYVAAMFVVIGINDLPFAINRSAWFAGRSAIAGVVLTLAAVWGLYAATASRPLPLAQPN